jgi:hypothetical protein
LPQKEKEVFKRTLKKVDRPAYRALVLLEGDKTPENIDASQKILLGSSDLEGVGSNGVEITKVNDDGTVVSVGENGKRTLKLADSDYKMNADIDNSDDLDEVNKIQKGLKKEVLPLSNAIGSIKSLIKSLDTWSKSGVNFEDIKNILKKG